MYPSEENSAKAFLDVFLTLPKDTRCKASLESMNSVFKRLEALQSRVDDLIRPITTRVRDCGCGETCARCIEYRRYIIMCNLNSHNSGRLGSIYGAYDRVCMLIARFEHQAPIKNPEYADAMSRARFDDTKIGEISPIISFDEIVTDLKWIRDCVPNSVYQKDVSAGAVSVSSHKK